MTLSPIGDIAQATLTGASLSPKTWETATDWDNAVSESGVVHEAAANTDYTDASVLRKGYATGANAPFASDDTLFYLTHEDSGSTAYDWAGNSRDGSINGPSVGNTGILGTTAYDFVASNSDTVDNTYGPYGSAPFTFVAWIKAGSQSQNLATITGNYDGSFPQVKAVIRDGTFRYRLRDSGGSDAQVDTGVTVDDGTWHMVHGSYRPLTDSIYASVDAGSFSSTGDSTSDTNLNSGSGVRLGARYDDNDFFDGIVGYAAWFDTYLTGTNVQTLYDTVLGESSLTSSTKSFAGSTKPDLQNLDYTLNGESITVDVIGSPGTASEEVVSQSLAGATSYNLTWSESHTDFRVRPRLSSTTPTATPTVNRIEIAPP